MQSVVSPVVEIQQSAVELSEVSSWQSAVVEQSEVSSQSAVEQQSVVVGQSVAAEDQPAVNQQSAVVLGSQAQAPIVPLPPLATGSWSSAPFAALFLLALSAVLFLSPAPLAALLPMALLVVLFLGPVFMGAQPTPAPSVPLAL